MITRYTESMSTFVSGTDARLFGARPLLAGCGAALMVLLLIAVAAI